MPANNGETSVYRTSGIGEKEILDIGKTYVADPQGKTVHARGDTVAKHITEIGLRIAAKRTPHVRHANIIGWPTAKDEQKMLAIELASKASLQLPRGDAPVPEKDLA